MVRQWSSHNAAPVRRILRVEILEARTVPSTGTEEPVPPPVEPPPAETAPPAPTSETTTSEPPPAPPVVETPPPVVETPTPPPVVETPPPPLPPAPEPPTPTAPTPVQPPPESTNTPTVTGSPGAPPVDTVITPTTPIPPAPPTTNGPAAESPNPAAQPLRTQPRPRYAVGSDAGQPTQVNYYDGPTGSLLTTFQPFGAGFTGGARVATGDVTGDGIEDVIIGAGPGGGAWVRVYDGKTFADLGAFLAYNPGFSGGALVAVGDVDGDGRADIVTGAGAGGGPHVQVFNGKALFPTPGASVAAFQLPAQSYFAYNPGFTGGVFVAAGDTDGDGHADVVTGAGATGGPHVKVFSGHTGEVFFSFFAYDAAYTGGVLVAAGDLDGDGKAELVTANNTGPTRVQSFRDTTLLNTFTVWGNGRGTGGRVAVEDIDKNGKAEILAATGPDYFPTVKIFNPNSGEAIREFPGFMQNYTGGLFVG